MANENPERYLLNMSKKLRKGKIFLDYLRNDRMATAVAVLSPRAREGATVSMPLTWAQVRGDLDPKRYTVRAVPALLAKTKAWQDYDGAAASIKAAIKTLLGSGTALHECKDTTSVWVKPGLPSRWRLSWSARDDKCSLRMALYRPGLKTNEAPRRGRA